LTGYHTDPVTFKALFGGYSMSLVLAYAAIYLIWGTTYLAIRIAVGSIPPLLMMGARCTAAGVLLLAWAAVKGHRMTWRQRGHAVVAGVLMFAVCYGGLAWAEQRLASGLTALLASTTPLWLVVFEWARGERPSAAAIAGVVVGVAGVALLVGGAGSAVFQLAPAAAVLCSTLAWAAGSLYARPRLPASLALGAGTPLVAGGVILLLLSWATHELSRFHAEEVSRASLAALAYLVVFGSLVAFSAYSWLLRVVPSWRVGTYGVVNPLIAVGVGAVLAGEPITAGVVVSALVIASSVVLVLAGR
jgi:drug/metabolite transporter (DMT)-like permease